MKQSKKFNNKAGTDPIELEKEEEPRLAAKPCGIIS